MTSTAITTTTEPVSERFALAVVTHDSRPDLEACFESQLALAEGLGVPLVAVDNDSSDGSQRWLAARGSRYGGFRLVRMSHNAGYAAAVNAALRAVPGRDLLLLNPDVEPAGPDLVRRLTRVLDREPGVAVVAPRLVSNDGVPQPSARRFPTPFAILGATSAGARIGPLRRARDRYLEPSSSGSAVLVDWAIGAALLLRREACDAVGGWDERYFLYVEDVDFCRRCARAGWNAAYVPEVAFKHRYVRASAAASASILSPGARRHHLRGLIRFWRRNPALLLGVGRRRGVRPLDAGIRVAECE